MCRHYALTTAYKEEYHEFCTKIISQKFRDISDTINLYSVAFVRKRYSVGCQQQNRSNEFVASGKIKKTESKGGSK